MDVITPGVLLTRLVGLGEEEDGEADEAGTMTPLTGAGEPRIPFGPT